MQPPVNMVNSFTRSIVDLVNWIQSDSIGTISFFSKKESIYFLFEKFIVYKDIINK